MVQLSCSFATNCRTKCYFSRAGQGRQQLIPLNSWVYSLKKKTFERRRCIPNMRFVREEAYSSAYWLIWRLRRPRIHDTPQISCTTWCEIQTFGFVNASILLIKNWRRKVEREVNLNIAEEIKAGGESSWWQGDCQPNRTRTVTAILESAKNKEEGMKSTYLNSVFLTGDLWLRWTLYHMIARDTQVL